MIAGAEAPVPRYGGKAGKSAIRMDSKFEIEWKQKRINGRYANVWKVYE